MAAPEAGESDNIFELLKKADPRDLDEREKAISDRLHRVHKLSQQRLAGLVDQNSTLPTTVSSVTVLGAGNTRHGFLQGVVDPLLSSNRDRPYTQSELIREVSKTAEKLKKFGLLNHQILG
jgi:outer membrane protein insertion porin family